MQKVTLLFCYSGKRYEIMIIEFYYQNKSQLTLPYSNQTQQIEYQTLEQILLEELSTAQNQVPMISRMKILIETMLSFMHVPFFQKN